MVLMIEVIMTVDVYFQFSKVMDAPLKIASFLMYSILFTQ
jgi:hypothetical protein